MQYISHIKLTKTIMSPQILVVGMDEKSCCELTLRRVGLFLEVFILTSTKTSVCISNRGLSPRHIDSRMGLCVAWKMMGRVQIRKRIF